MKIILYILLISSPTIGMAQTAAEGSYIVVRSALKDCSEWGNRILDVVKIENQATITILEMPGFSVVGLSRDQLENELSEAINKITGKSPETLSVDILTSDEEYQAIAKEYLFSLRMLVDGNCPYRKTNDPEEIQEEDLEKMRLKDISKRIAVRSMHTKSFKSVSPENWLHQTRIRRTT
ncbi:MAG: hypothetical protein IMF09_02195 [Proteobacteria bacterium]|nr:hypothetical protein [Pseudomonadota bacterium]